MDIFLVLAANEQFNQASGCSIDASVHFVQQLETTFGLRLFDRTKTAVWQADELVFKTTAELKTDIQNGTFDDNTLIFNNLVQTINELKTAWQVRAGSSWLSRFFKQAKVTV